MRMLMVIVIIFPFMALRSCLLSSPKRSTSDRKCLKENLKRRKTLTQTKENEVIIASQSS